MKSPEPADARISIIGAGPGGLTCARILQQRGIAVTVYDRDPGRDFRNQGGTLDLHADHAQVALREAGLLDEFFALARPEGQELRQMDPTGAITFHRFPEHWSPRMRQMITENDGLYIHRPIFVLPVSHTWDHNPTVTLLGDAAHLMPPARHRRQPRHA